MATVAAVAAAAAGAGALTAVVVVVVFRQRASWRFGFGFGLADRLAWSCAQMPTNHCQDNQARVGHEGDGDEDVAVLGQRAAVATSSSVSVPK